MKIYYSLGFYIDPQTGRGSGSVSKIKSLSGLCEEFHWSSYPLRRGEGYFFTKMLNMVLHWLRDIFTLLILGRRIDVIIIRDNIFFPIWLAHVRQILVCSEVHAVPWEEIGESSMKRALAALYRRRYIAVLKASDLLIFNNPRLADYYQSAEQINRPSYVSYNGGTFSASSKPSGNLNVSGLHKFVYAGNIYPWHGLELLLPVVKTLSEKLDMVFFLVGDTGTAYAIEVQDKFREMKACTVVKESSKEVITDYIRQADYCFLPTSDTRSSPGNPIKLFDYLAEGKRIITQKECPGYSDIVASAEAGILVNFYRPEEAARKILASNPSQSTPQLEQKIIETCKNRHSWDRRMMDWIDFFKQQEQRIAA